MRFVLKDSSWKLKISESEHLANHIQRSVFWRQMSLLDIRLTTPLVTYDLAALSLGTAIILADTNFL